MPVGQNYRIIWAIQAFGIAPQSTTSYVAVHGLQSVGITTSFNLEQVFEIGQLAIYENIEGIPSVEVTLEKVIDGYPLLYHLATRGYSTGTLIGRSNRKVNCAMSIFGDTQDSASGVPQAEIFMSGMFLNSVSYTMPVEGNCTEQISLIGTNKIWRNAAGATFSGSLFNNTDTPLALTSGTGGVQRRENVIFGGTNDTILPPDVAGISSSGTNDKDSEGFYKAAVQNININVNLNRGELFELGMFGPYFRYANFPIEVNTEIEIISKSGDTVNCLETGSNLSSRSIKVKLQDSTFINLGSSNKLLNSVIGGGETGGGNQTVTYSFTTFNDFTVTHDQDPG